VTGKNLLRGVGSDRETLDKSKFLEGVNEELLKVSSSERKAPFQIGKNLRRRFIGFTSLQLYA